MALQRACVRRTGGRLLATWLVWCGLASTASAHNVDGKLGVGLEETLTDVGVRQIFPVRDASGTLQPVAVPDVRASGLSFRYYVGNLGLEAITGVAMRLPANAPTEFGAFVSLGAIYNLFRAPSVNLGVGARVLAGMARSNNGTSAGPVRAGMAIEAPIRVEYFFSPNFAVAGAIGPTLAINGSEINPLTGGKDSYDISLTRGDFSGGIGFTYYLQ